MDDILLQKQVEELKEKSKDGEYTIKASLYEKDRDKEDERGDALDAKFQEEAHKMLIPVSRHRVIFQKLYLVNTGPKTQVTNIK